MKATAPTGNPALEVALEAVWLIMAVKSGVIAPALVVAGRSAPSTPNVAEGTGREEVSTARTAMVAVLGTWVVDAAAKSLLVGAAVAGEVGRVKERRAAQVAGSSPCVVVRLSRIVLDINLHCNNSIQLQERRSRLLCSIHRRGGNSSS